MKRVKGNNKIGQWKFKEKAKSHQHYIHWQTLFCSPAGEMNIQQISYIYRMFIMDILAVYIKENK